MNDASRAIRNHLQRSHWLLERGARPTSPHSYNQRNLHTEAWLGGYTQLAQLLTEFGASPERLNDRQTCLAACMRGDRKTVRKMVAAHPEYLRHPTAMFQAADADRVDIAQFLLELGRSPDVGQGSWTALHACAHNGSLGVAKLLIEHGARIDVRDRQYNATPLGHAQWAGQTAMVALLGSVSRDVFALVRAGNRERLQHLLDEKPKLIHETLKGQSALFFLSDPEERAIEVAELLIARGADTSFADAEGKTPADIAAKRGLEELAQFLLESRPGGTEDPE